MTSRFQWLENIPRLMVFLQECLFGPVVMEPKHCGLQMDSGGLERGVTLEQPHNIYTAPTLQSVLSLSDHTGNTGMVMSGWMLKEMQRCMNMKKTYAPMKCIWNWMVRHMMSSILRLENTPRQMVVLQECL